MKLHRTAVLISRVSNAVSATGRSPHPSPWNNDNRKNTSLGTLATLSIPRAVHPGRMRVLSRAVHRRKNEWRDKSSAWREREDTGWARPSRWNLLPIFFFLRPENRVESTCRVSAAEHAPRQPRGGAWIYLCVPHTPRRTPARVRNIERNNPRVLAREADSVFGILSILAPTRRERDPPVSQKRNSSGTVYSGLYRRL